MILDIKTKIISGRTKKESLVPNLVRKSKRILIVADPSVDQSLINAVSDNFTAADCVIYKNIPLKPTSRIVENITDIIIHGFVETVIGIGGVKTLNLAKMSAAAAKSGIPVDDILDMQSIPESGTDADYIEIPSSVRNPLMFSPYAVIVDGRNRSVKYINTGITPSIVVSDPDFNDSISPVIFDALCFEIILGSLEGLASLNRGYFPDSLNKCGLSELFKAEYGIKSDRASEIALTASLAQAATGPGIGFFLSCFLNSRSSAPKAVLAAILMPHILEWYFKRYPPLIEIVNTLLPGDNEMNSEDFIQFLRKRVSMKSLPLRLSEAGVHKDIYPYVISSLPMMYKSSYPPVDISEEEVSEILKKAF